MSQIIETTVYHLDELPDGAKDKARAWYREHIIDDDWVEFVYDDFETICTILGIRLKTRSVPLMNGGTRSKPCVFFRGFWSQGDGACFEAVYSYEKNARRRLIEHAPEDTTLHAIADALQSIQRRNFYHLRADIRHRGRCSKTLGRSLEESLHVGVRGGGEVLIPLAYGVKGFGGFEAHHLITDFGQFGNRGS